MCVLLLFLSTFSFYHKMLSMTLWYFEWFVLGIFSSIGLGSGAHTFMLFLAPFIAETATTAFICNSLNFETRGPNR